MSVWLGHAILAPPAARAQTIKEETKAQITRASVMVITAASRNTKGDTPIGSGSGLFINSTGLLCTNNHVVDPTHGESPEKKQQFHYSTGPLTWTAVVNSGTDEESSHECTVIYQNESADQAILQCRDENGDKLDTPDYLRLLPESRLHQRMKIWALGFPSGDRQSTNRDKHPPVTITTGNVLEAPRTPGGRIRMIYTDVVARPGNSGGPMVDVDGFALGVVTLMRKPEDREDTGGANYSALSPARLTREMVRNAYLLGKMPTGSDFTPFIKELLDRSGRVNVEEFARQRKQDAVFFENGDRIYGQILNETLGWESPLGTFEIPRDAVAYLVRGDEDSKLVLEGGDMLAGAMSNDVFRFKPEGGEERDQDLEGVHVIGFRTAGREVAPIEGTVLAFNSDVSQLVLSGVEGTVRFSGLAGTVSIPVQEIERIDVSPDDDEERVLTLVDGRRMTGTFGKAAIAARIAATNTPIELDLSEVTHATVELRHMRGNLLGGLDLAGVMHDADREISRMVKALDGSDVASARSMLDELLSPSEFKRLPGLKRDQVTLLDGVVTLREGKYDEAMKRFRKASRSGDSNVAAYASACASLLKRFDNKFEGKPLSDPDVFAQAGAALSRELISEIRDFVKDAKSLTGERRADYIRVINNARKQEEAMAVAAIFGGADADDELIRVWKLAVQACAQEIARIDKDLEESRTAGSGGGRRSGTLLRSQREMDVLREDRRKAEEEGRAYSMKLFEYGFRIDDPDIQDLKERERSFED